MNEKRIRRDEGRALKCVGLILTLLSLAGCSESDVLREDPTSARFEATLPEDYQAAYRRLLATANKCNDLAYSYNSATEATGDISSGAHEAVVSLHIRSAIGDTTIWTANLKGDGDVTHVTVIIADPFKRSAPSVLRLVHGAFEC